MPTWTSLSRAISASSVVDISVHTNMHGKNWYMYVMCLSVFICVDYKMPQSTCVYMYAFVYKYMHIYTHIYRATAGVTWIQVVFLRSHLYPIRVGNIYNVPSTAMEDLLDLLTYDCPFTGKKRCAADPFQQFGLKRQKILGCRIHSMPNRSLLSI